MFGYGITFSVFFGQPSITFIPYGKLNNIFQSHVEFGARVLAFSLENALARFLKIPYLLLACVCGSREDVIQICHVL